MLRYKRLVTLHAGVMVEFESDIELTDEEQAEYAEAVAADAASQKAAEGHHPYGEVDDMGYYVNKDASIVPVGIKVDINTVNDEGDWS